MGLAAMGVEICWREAAGRPGLHGGGVVQSRRINPTPPRLGESGTAG